MSRQRSRVRNRVEFLTYRLARSTAHAVGPRTLAGVGRTVGAIFHRLGGRRRAILEFNLKLAYPELPEGERRDLARAVARHFGIVSLDAVRLQRIQPDELMSSVTMEGLENLRAVLEADRGFFFLSAHLGCWEVAALVAGLQVPGGMAVVYRPLDNPLLDVELRRLRSHWGNQMLGRHRIGREMIGLLNDRRGVGILIDQRARPNYGGVLVPFFGRPAWTHSIVGKICAGRHVPVVPIWGLWDAPGRYTVRFDEPLWIEPLGEAERTPEAITARLTGLTEGAIRERPEQWLWYHDRWRHLRCPSTGGDTTETELPRGAETPPGVAQ